MKSLLLGKRGQWKGTEGNVSFGLITQRSKVQILPPQPIHSKSVSFVFLLPKTSTHLIQLLVSHSFFDIGLMTTRCVRQKYRRQAQIVRFELDPIVSLPDSNQFYHQTL